MSRPCSVGINPRPGRSGPLLRGRSGSGEHQTRVLSCAGPGAECCWLTPGGAALRPGRSPGGAGGSAALVARVPSPGWEAGRPRCARTGPEASWLPPAPAQPGARPAECRAVRVSPQPVAARASAFQPAGFWPSSAVHVNAFLGRCSPEVLRTVGSQDSGFSGWWLPRMVGSQDSGSQDGGFSGPWLLRTVASQDGGFSGRWAVVLETESVCSIWSLLCPVPRGPGEAWLPSARQVAAPQPSRCGREAGDWKAACLLCNPRFCSGGRSVWTALGSEEMAPSPHAPRSLALARG